MDKLRQALKERQIAEGVSVWQMAALIGVNAAGYQRFMAGVTTAGPHMARKIVARYPELRDVVTVALLGEDFQEAIPA